MKPYYCDFKALRPPVIVHTIKGTKQEMTGWIHTPHGIVAAWSHNGNAKMALGTTVIKTGIPDVSLSMQIVKDAKTHHATLYFTAPLTDRAIEKQANRFAKRVFRK